MTETTIEKHEIDMRTPEQLEQEEIQLFMEDLKKLQDKHQRDLTISMKYEPNGIFPVMSIPKRKKQ